MEKLEQVNLLRSKRNSYATALTDLEMMINIWENESRSTIGSLFYTIFKMFKNGESPNRSVHSFLNEDEELYNKIREHLKNKIENLDTEVNNYFK